MSDQIIAPLFVQPPGPRYTVAEAAKLIARPGVSPETTASQIRRFAQHRWVHVAGQRGSGPTAANLFSPVDVAAAAALSAVVDLGIEDRTVMAAAGMALYSWSGWVGGKQEQRPGNPIANALVAASRMQDWILDIRVFRGDQTGARHVWGWCYDPDEPPAFRHEPSDESLPIGGHQLMLLPLLLPVYRRMTAANAGH
jgi:hypothetical protein